MVDKLNNNLNFKSKEVKNSLDLNNLHLQDNKILEIQDNKTFENTNKKPLEESKEKEINNLKANIKELKQQKRILETEKKSLTEKNNGLVKERESNSQKLSLIKDEKEKSIRNIKRSLSIGAVFTVLSFAFPPVGIAGLIATSYGVNRVIKNNNELKLEANIETEIKKINDNILKNEFEVSNIGNLEKGIDKTLENLNDQLTEINKNILEPIKPLHDIESQNNLDKSSQLKNLDKKQDKHIESNIDEKQNNAFKGIELDKEVQNNKEEKKEVNQISEKYIERDQYNTTEHNFETGAQKLINSEEREITAKKDIEEHKSEKPQKQDLNDDLPKLSSKPSALEQAKEAARVASEKGIEIKSGGLDKPPVNVNSEKLQEKSQISITNKG
ncbi:MAG: hypothetical protein J0H68_08515 [Sphingobacteriia bacterium]|nr:hypothetical protein [Sphingobacteriia bacterium]